jgi:hypothetical protein
MACVIKTRNLQILKAIFDESFCELIFFVEGLIIGTFLCLYSSKLNSFHAMARAVSIQCLTAEDQFKNMPIPVGFVMDAVSCESFSPSTSVFSVSIVLLMLLTFIHSAII